MLGIGKVLVCEDEEAINRMICLNLTVVGYETVSCFDGKEALDYLENGGTADIALVDIMMPNVDGFELLGPLTEHGIPVIFLTACGDLESRIKGLTSGAEDYIVKPFDMPEVLVRIEKVLKRNQSEPTILVLSDIIVDTKRHEVRRNNEILTLTPMEYDLLLYLAVHKNCAIGREKLLGEIWGFDYVGETRTVDVHIAQLRRKTGLSIVSIPKIGYRLENKTDETTS